VPANGQVTLSWNAPVGAQSFNIYRGTVPGGESATPLATGVAGTAFVDTTVTNGTEYYYEVTAVDTGAKAPPRPKPRPCRRSQPFRRRRRPRSPRHPRQNGPAGVASGAGASSYNVYRGAASGGEVLLQSGVSGPVYSDSGLTDGATYYYQVTAVNPLGESPRSSEVSPRRT